MLRLVFTILLGLALTAAQPQLRGVNYGIQLPDGSCGPYSQVLSDFQLIATFAQAVKIYNMGFCNGAENSIIAARATGLKLFLGMAAGPPDAFQNELSILTTLSGKYGWANIIGITVGSEDLYRQSVSASTIAGYITQVQSVVKNSGGTVPVTHVDVYYLQPAEILAVEDIVMFNAFTFWEGQPIDNALATFISHYNSVVAGANGKTVWIGETGWPVNGATVGSSVPSSANAATYVQQFICWANANGVPYFYFEAFDEPWKSSQDNGAIEASFGLYDSNRNKKDYFSFSCPNSGQQQTSTGTPATTASSANCQSMFSTLSCTTSSEDPSQVDSNSVSNARGWLCANYPQFCTAINSGGQYSSCNSVEQVSYAMSQYYNTYSSQGASACSFGGLGHVTGNSGSATTGNSAGSSTTGNSAGSSTTGNSAGSSTTGNSAGSSTTSNSGTPSTSTSNSNTCQKASYCLASMCACNGACYDQTQYCCVSGQLTQASFCRTSTTGGSSTTGNSAGSSTTGNSAGSSTTGNPTPTSSSTNCQSMFSTLSCTTSSEDPSQVDSNSVNNARGWLCANYPQFCTAINSGGQYGSCNSVEQISYAMSQYYNTYSSQGSSACSFGGLGHVTGNSGSATTGNSAGSSTTGNSAGSSTTGNSAGSSTTGNSAGSSTTGNSAGSSTTGNATPSTSTSNTCQTMFSSLKCRTKSEDPSQVDSSSVNNARGWLCANYPQYCTAINSGGQYSSCNSVEQISYGMNQYYNANAAQQGANACSFGGLGQVVSRK